MATLTETQVKVTVSIRRAQDNSPLVYIGADSLDADGNVIRSVNRNITDELNQTQLTTAENIITAAENRAKSYYGIA